MAEGAIIEYKDGKIISGEIIWLEPISYLMKPKILEYNKKGRTQKVRIRPLVLPQADDFRTEIEDAFYELQVWVSRVA